MQGIAEAVFGEHQQGAPLERFALPFRLTESRIAVRQRLALAAPPIGFEPLGEMAVHQQEMRVVVLRERLLRIERNCAGRDRERLVDLAGVAQRDREVGVALGIGRIDRNRAAMRGDRIGDALLLLEDDAEIGVGRRVIGLEQQRVLAGRNGVVEFAEIGETGPEIGGDHVIGGIARECLPVDLGSLVQMTGFMQHETKQAQRRDIVGREFDGTAILDDGLFEQSLPIERRAEIADQSDIVGIELERAAIGGHGIAQPVLVRQARCRD